jgi:hypothetical protein
MVVKVIYSGSKNPKPKKKANKKPKEQPSPKPKNPYQKYLEEYRQTLGSTKGARKFWTTLEGKTAKEKYESWLT